MKKPVNNCIIKYWLRSQSHRLMECKEFIKLLYRSKIDFGKENFWNCLLKGYEIKRCISTFHCHKDGCQKKHHTLLHPATNEDSSESVKLSNDVRYKNDYHTQLQIIPVIVSSDGIKIKTTALLDSDFESTMISHFQSKLVNFQVSCNAHLVQCSSKMLIPEESSINQAFDMSIYMSNTWSIEDTSRKRL